MATANITTAADKAFPRKNQSNKKLRALKTEEHGRMLAAHLLDDMEHCLHFETAGSENALWPWSIRAKYRPKNWPQENSVLDCIELLQRTGTPEALAGFCSVLTDHLGQVSVGPGPMFPRVYRTLKQREITGTPGRWPKFSDSE